MRNYKKYMDGLVRHILSRVDKDGEMIGYYIHPKFNDGKAIINPDDDTKKELFSFYFKAFRISSYKACPSDGFFVEGKTNSPFALNNKYLGIYTPFGSFKSF